jgi:hypothetical protein
MKDAGGIDFANFLGKRCKALLVKSSLKSVAGIKAHILQLPEEQNLELTML